MAAYDWSTIASVQDIDTAACKLSDSILSLVNECFPQIKVRISSRDPPCHHWLTDLQNQINKLIRGHQIRAVKQKENKNKQGSRGWWKTIDRMTGRRTKTTNISSTIGPKTINTYFHCINSDAYYTTRDRAVYINV